jgi:hypothetical protein
VKSNQILFLIRVTDKNNKIKGSTQRECENKYPSYHFCSQKVILDFLYPASTHFPDSSDEMLITYGNKSVQPGECHQEVYSQIDWKYQKVFWIAS